MKATMFLPTEVNVTHVKIEVAVRYDEEDIPNDFPMREGDMWKATVEIDTGKILGWPQGTAGSMHMKVCDEGTYIIYNEKGEEVMSIVNDYVPNNLIPGEYGDYIDLKINEQGIITNWPKHPSLEDFTDDNDE